MRAINYELYFILILMIFFHILDDFCLQQVLAKLKQRNWWRENYPQKMYSKDYKLSLFIHSFEWGVMVHLPITVYLLFVSYDVLMTAPGFLTWITCFSSSIIIHSIIDHIKANLLKINLCQDQCFHLIQIVTSWVWLSDIALYSIK